MSEHLFYYALFYAFGLILMGFYYRFKWRKKQKDLD
jgi:hypothetical protein